MVVNQLVHIHAAACMQLSILHGKLESKIPGISDAMMVATQTRELIMAIPQRRMTLEEFLELPEEKPALEFEDGVVTQKVPPQGKHARLQPWICELINRQTTPSKLALAFSELRATYGGRSRVPDIAVFRWERIPLDPDGRIADDFLDIPDIAIEILSPGQSMNQLELRCATFVDQGAGAAVLVNPYRESVLAFRPGALPTPLDRSGVVDLGDVVPGLTLSVADIFDALTL
jgi:Uma2 family endonuclease